MSVKELKFGDEYSRTLHFGKYGGQIYVIPIVEKIGDAIVITDYEAHLLKLWLEEHLK